MNNTAKVMRDVHQGFIKMRFASATINEIVAAFTAATCRGERFLIEAINLAQAIYFSLLIEN
jgi:hypothetical protein